MTSMQILFLSSCVLIVTMTSTPVFAVGDIRTRRPPTSSTVSTPSDKSRIPPRPRVQKQQKTDNGERPSLTTPSLTTLGQERAQSNETRRHQSGPVFNTSHTGHQSNTSTTIAADEWQQAITVSTTTANYDDYIVDLTTATATKPTQPPIVFAISVLSKSNRTKIEGLFVTVGDKLKAPRTTKPQLSEMGIHVNMSSSTVSYRASSSSSSQQRTGKQSALNVFDDLSRGDKLPETVTRIDNHLSPVAPADKNQLPSHWSVVTGLSSSSSPEAALAPSTFPLVTVDDETGWEIGSGTDWETVNELLREVGHQLAGLRSFIRRLRTDNSAVYRDIVQTVLRINRANTAAGMVQCLEDEEDDDDDKEEDKEEDDEDDDDLQEPVRSPSPLVLQQLTAEGSSVIGTVAEVHRHRHGHGTIKRGGEVVGRSRCPPGYERVPTSSSSNTCFRLVTERVTWTTARQRCSSVGANLASIRSPVEQRHLAELARKKYETMHCDFWIGLTRMQTRQAISQSKHRHSSLDRHRSIPARSRPARRLLQHRRRPSSTATSSEHRSLHRDRLNQRSEWHWITDTPSDSLPGTRKPSTPSSRTVIEYFNWNEGEPNDAGVRRHEGGVEQCVEALWVFDWKWNDAHCDGPSTACYVCQTDELL